MTAAGRSAEDELSELRYAVAASTLPERELFDAEAPNQWSAALRLLAELLPDEQPSVVVIDEVPYLMDRVDAFEGVLQRAWDRLLSRKPVLVAAELPVSLRPSKERRYRTADPYLRFWLTFLTPYMAEIERMRGDLTLLRILENWSSWRGRAVEPLIRESLARLLPDEQLPAAPVVGGYWTRSNDVEIDLVGADRGPVAKQLVFVGSIKWLDKSRFDDHDLTALQRHRAALTDDPVRLVAVSRSGVTASGLDAVYGPEDLLAGWNLR